jgi:small subunit ribosomal protein S10
LKANRLRIKLRAYDHRLLDRSATAIVRSVVKTGATVSGPIPLPTRRSMVTVLRSPHVNKKSREQFEMKVHSRLIEIVDPNEETAAALRSQDVPSGVDVEMNEI